MAKGKAGVDKNLTNVVSDLERDPANSHEAQQMQQAVNDRRHRDALNRHKNKDMDPTH
ncbi:hypothetical protein HMSSN036_78020 [Paenibacillus macerans]|uniref:Uncharacterized protein n=1 Tax=Paenibacillus macerans TaxID=44252 RepID=A0A090Z8C4_PAEMA|nr:hypothetical protein [Paenibacillus macerans]KFN06480.1 hypothetical protein DJ90_4195 [Paenibacillus macerans]MBS5909078.1 hypothetical protein [Paenibacillus macerans]MCY7560538.1 hypothetical protein [Paenibacillus macerans]MDU5946351.1 hypothetical protein [Paenibacillus macerans]MDU7475205.1 hypothetical protein [Paenibacillus macerans]